MIKITVSTSSTGLDPTCTESMEYGGKTQDYKFLCSPPARGSYVTVTLIGDNVTLVLCHVVVKSIGELDARIYNWRGFKVGIYGATFIGGHKIFFTNFVIEILK